MGSYNGWKNTTDLENHGNNNGYNNIYNKGHNKRNNDYAKTDWAGEILKDRERDYYEHRMRSSRSIEDLDQHHNLHARRKHIISPPSSRPSKSDSKTRSESGYAPSIQSEENDRFFKQPLKNHPFSPGSMEESDSADEGVIRSHFRKTPNLRTPSFGSQPADFHDHQRPRDGTIRRIGIKNIPRHNLNPHPSKPPPSHTSHNDPVSYWESKWSSEYSGNRGYNNHDDLKINNLRSTNTNPAKHVFSPQPPKLHPRPHHHSTNNLLNTHSTNNLLDTHSNTSKRSNFTHNSYNDNNDRRYNNYNNVNGSSNIRSNINKSNPKYNRNYNNNNYNHNDSRFRSTSNNNNTNNNRNISNSSNNNNDTEFLSRVQQELENQRMNWTSEIDKLLSPMSSHVDNKFSFGSPPQDTSKAFRRSTPIFNAEKNSFVDTSGPLPIFKAFVDVSEYPAKSVSVGLDNLGNKVVIEAGHAGSPANNVAMTFTQKISLPRYADLANMTAKVNRKGLVKVEIPLLFYFPQDHLTRQQRSANNGQRSDINQQQRQEVYGKSYVSEVRTDARGEQVMEIVVKPGANLSADDVVVEVVDERLLRVCVEVGSERGPIKTYGLPDTADPGRIRSRVDEDGLVIVSIPVGV